MPSDRANSPGRLILQITAVVLLTALLAGILVFERRRNAAGLSLVEADVTTVEERAETVGYVFRTETVLKSEKDGALRYTVADGAEVAADDPLLYAYAGKGDGGDRAVGRILSAELTFWRTLAAADGAWQTDYFDAYRRLMALYDANGTASGAGDRLQAAADLLEALNRREADRDAILLRIEALEREFDALVRDAGTPETVVSPVTGRFFDSVDGYETLLDPSLLTDLTPAGVEALLETPVADPTAVGRVVTGISVLAVPVSAKVAATLTVGQTCDMLLGNEWRAEMVLKSISAADEEGRVLLTFLAPEEVDCERKWKVSFLTGTHTGIRVPMGAVRNEDDGLFVYVAEDGCAVRRRIEPILYRDGYCLSAVDAGEGALAVGEKIVLTSRRIYEGKKLK